MKITTNIFQGIRPLVDAHLLGENEAQNCIDFRIDNGTLRPFDAASRIQASDYESVVRTIYFYLQQYWFEFTADVDIVPGPVYDTTNYRRYYTGDGIPKKTNLSEATTGSGTYPINFYPLAVPTPLTAPTAVPGGGGSGDDREISYCWTIITSWAEEGHPSPACDVVDAKNGETVALSGMTLEWQASTAYTTGQWVIPTVLGDYVYKCVAAGTTAGIEPSFGETIDGDTNDGSCVWRCYSKEILYGSGGAKRIYRTNTGNQYGSWQMVADIAMSATTYSDTKTDAELETTVLPSEDWDPPPDDLTGLKSIGRFMVGFRGNQLCFSEINYPHAWPEGYRLSLDYTIIAIGVIGNSVCVGTDERPYVVIGSLPESMDPKKKNDLAPCLSKRGSCQTPAGWVYPTNDGLFSMGFDSDGDSVGGIITKKHYLRADWKDLSPEGFTSAFYDGKYIAFYDGGALMFDFNTGQLSYLSTEADAVFVDPESGELYYVVATDDVILAEDGTPYPGRDGAILAEDGTYILAE